MLDGTYSKQVYWNDSIDAVIDHVFSFQYLIQVTHHAQQKIRSLQLPLSCYKPVCFGEVIEAEFEEGRLVKIVTRMQHSLDPSIDLVAAVLINPDGSYGNVLRVKTIWTNEHNDNHSTIDKSAYVKGE